MRVLCTCSLGSGGNARIDVRWGGLDAESSRRARGRTCRARARGHSRLGECSDGSAPTDDKRCARADQMKPSALRIERLLAKVEAELVPPPLRWLRVIIDEDDEVAEAKKKEGACRALGTRR
jgi:hypothetical protein